MDWNRYARLLATRSTDRSRGGVLLMNKSARLKRSLVTTAIAACTLYAGAWRAEADFIQTNLVSDIQGLAAITDPALHNPWGISHSDTSPFWVSNQGTNPATPGINTATLYGVTAGNVVTKVNINPPSGFVGIPTTASGPQGPTGQVKIQTPRPSS
jgi:hypothetical protein